MKLMLYIFLCLSLWGYDSLDPQATTYQQAFRIVSTYVPKNDEEKGIQNYLKAVFSAKKEFRDEAEHYISTSKAPYALAIKGSIQTLKARDFGGNETTRTLLSLTPIGFARLYYVSLGINLLDTCIANNPHDTLSHFIRAMTYISLPKAFFQLDKGLEDITFLERQLHAFPHSHPLFLDKPTLLWLFAQYALRYNNLTKAKYLLAQSAAISSSHPFSYSSKEILNEILLQERK